MGLKWLPNALTVIRCLLAPAVAWLIIIQMPLIALIAFILVAMTDFVDGYAARKLEATSAFGAFLDPVADKLLVALCLLALCAVHDWTLVLTIPTLLIILRDTGVTILRVLPLGPLPVTRAAKWKTATEMVGIVVLLGSALVPETFMQTAIYAGFTIVAIAALLSLHSGVLYAANAISQTQNDRA